MKTQGRCWTCHIAYRWNAGRRALLKWAYCPRCKGKLAQTTHLYSGKWDENNPPIFSKIPPVRPYQP